MTRLPALALAAVLLASVVPAAGAQTERPTEIVPGFPEGFPEILDHSLGVPVIGFGSDAGGVTRTPVIFLHGNNDTPYPTDCNGAYGKIRDFAQHLLAAGYAPAELWALGYQGEQCDLLTDPTQRSGEAHSTVANVPDLRAFVTAVLDFTGATQVDIVGHSLGTTLAREWMRQDDAHHLVRRLVGVDGPNHGILNCSPNPANFWQTPATGGFHPDSAICLEYGAADTPLLSALNAEPTPGPTEYLMIVNADTSFVYVPEQDGLVPPVPAEDRKGRPHDFSRSAVLPGAGLIELTGQGRYDDALQAAHTGIVNSPEVWAATLDFLTSPAPTSPPAHQPPAEPAPAPTAEPVAGSRAPAAPSSSSELPATGGGAVALALALAGLGVALRRAQTPR